MNLTLHGPAARRTVGLGLAAGCWLMLSASTLGVETTVPAGAAPGAAQPDRVLVAQADAAPAETAVHYSSEQADRGKAFVIKHCAECHGEDLRGGLNGGPPLRGLAFEGKYAEGAPASAIFEFMSTLMPPDSPGRYSAAQYADAMAYILKVNGFQAGAELPSDVEALNTLIMEK